MKNRMKTLAQVFKALGDQKRLKIIKLLASNMEDKLCVTDVAEKLKISQPAASQHIKVLKNVGLLEENRQGFRVFYTINTAVFIEYKNEIDGLFVKGFQKCPYDLDCEKCEYNCGS